MRKKRDENQVSHINFKPLMRVLFEREMSTSDLCKNANISASTMTEIRANRSVTLETVVKICLTLDCPIESIVEITRED